MKSKDLRAFDHVCARIGAKILRVASLPQDDIAVLLYVLTFFCFDPIAQLSSKKTWRSPDTTG
ncbi:MAG: hypothetical protein II320_06020, partial [Oscillospiraceae bacterium]|nr:hypothetical protein [Oscillospiraceae bacterium]